MPLPPASSLALSTTAVLRPLKLKSSPARLSIGRGKSNRSGRPSPGQSRQLRTARVRQAQQLGGLVEGLAGRVVQGLAEHAIAAETAHLDEHRVPAGNQQRHEGKGRRIVLQQWRQQVRLHVMDRDAPAPASAAASPVATVAPTSKAPISPGPAV